MSQIATHKVFSCPTRQAARILSASEFSNATYVYFYDHPLSFPGWGANFSYCNGHVCHGSELPVLYNSATSYGFQFQRNEIVLSTQMQQFWSKFAQGSFGPIHIDASITSWPLYWGNFTLQLNVTQLVVQQNRLQEFCDMWDKVGYN